MCYYLFKNLLLIRMLICICYCIVLLNQNKFLLCIRSLMREGQVLSYGHINIYTPLGRAGEPANFFSAPAPDFFFQAAPAPDFFPKRLRLLVFFSSGSSSDS